MVTDANGNYTFGSVDGLLANSDYQISVDVSTMTNIEVLPDGFTAVDLVETLVDSTLGGASDINDSDVMGGVIDASTGAAGENDHSFDAGYTLPFDVALRKTADADSVDLDERTVTFLVEVHNQGQTIEDFEVTDYLGAPTPRCVGRLRSDRQPRGSDHAGRCRQRRRRRRGE